MEILSLQEAIGSSPPKFLVYGGAGSGKTTLLASLLGTRPGRVLVLSAEAGLRSLRGLLAEPDAAASLDVVAIKGITDLRAAYRTIEADPARWGWIVLDSITEIAEQIVDAEKKAERKKDKPNKWAPYDVVLEEVTALLRSFRDLPTGVYFSAKEARVVDGATKVANYEIEMPGAKLGAAIPYLFDEVYRLVVDNDSRDESGNPPRWLITRPVHRSVAKSRSGGLDELEPADLGAILKKIA